MTFILVNPELGCETVENSMNMARDKMSKKPACSNFKNPILTLILGTLPDPSLANTLLLCRALFGS